MFSVLSDSGKSVKKLPKKKEPREDAEYGTRKKENTFPNSTPPKEAKAPAIETISCECGDGFECDLENKTISHKLKASQDQILEHRKGAEKMGFNSDDWLFTQATIMSSTVVDDGFKVHPKGAKYVNGNGNGISNELFKKYYPTFKGAMNCLDHDQDPANSIGIIIDAVLREIHPYEDDPDFKVYYCDLLIATNRKERAAEVEAIENGVIKFLSMGCFSSSLQCSRCGNISIDEDDFCQHVEWDLGRYYIDIDGIKRITANMITDYPNEDGQSFIRFIEASYLTEDPAFAGAATSYIIDVPKNTDIWVEMPKGTKQREAYQKWSKYIKG